MADYAELLQQWRQRTIDGAREYGDRSFGRPVHETVRQILEEQVDQVGWIWILWCQAARKTDFVRNLDTLRDAFEERLLHRLVRNDRSRPPVRPGQGATTCMGDLEVLAMDLVLHHEHLQRRLQLIAHGIEVAPEALPVPNQGRRGGRPDPRSDD